jgi:hypothetical protein
MPEWLAVVVAGLLGGLLGTFLPSGGDVPFPMPVRTLLDKRRSTGLTYHLMRNSLFGGVASLLLWGMYNSQATFTGQSVTVRAVAVSLVVGGGGVGIVDALFREAQQGVAIDNLARAITELLPAEQQDTEERADEHD